MGAVRLRSIRETVFLQCQRGPNLLIALEEPVPLHRERIRWQTVIEPCHRRRKLERVRQLLEVQGLAAWAGASSQLFVRTFQHMVPPRPALSRPKAGRPDEIAGAICRRKPARVRRREKAGREPRLTHTMISSEGVSERTRTGKSHLMRTA